MNDEVSQWFAKLAPPQRELLETLRQLIFDAADNASSPIDEALKWNRPCYAGNRLFCYLQSAKGHVAIGFQQGALLDDPDDLLLGDGKLMRHIKLPLAKKIDENAIRALINSAIELDTR